ncbi:MAG: VF530 family DNA-binding protein [Undibacterium curvum]|uniref:VF530 family protein n=1 Tax=Undibacterium curvum TaxID=2762294 RepID=UPI003BE47FDA
MPNNSLDGITLEQLLTRLQAHYGWPGLAQHVPIRCFQSEPSISSSLKFLRKTPWARTKVEQLFLDTDWT